jgi:hypothetical protein
MVSDHLTDAMIDAGEALTRQLENTGIPIEAAFWWLDSENREWRLLFASSDVSLHGSRPVYERISQTIVDMASPAEAVPFSLVGLLEENAEEVQLLRKVLGTGCTKGRMRCSRSAVNGRFIEDALVYRI